MFVIGNGLPEYWRVIRDKSLCATGELYQCRRRFRLVRSHFCRRSFSDPSEIDGCDGVSVRPRTLSSVRTCWPQKLYCKHFG